MNNIESNIVFYLTEDNISWGIYKHKNSTEIVLYDYNGLYPTKRYMFDFVLDINDDNVEDFIKNKFDKYLLLK